MKNSFNPYKHKARLLKEIASPIGAVDHMEGLKGKDESQDFFDAKIKSPFMLVSFLQKSLCKLYSHPVKRTLNVENDQLSDLLKEVESAFNGLSLDELTLITGTTALKCHYDADDDRLYMLHFDSSMLDATPNPTNPLKIDELEISYQHSGVSQTEVWSKDSVTTSIDGSRAKSEDNPYGFLPFTLFHNSRTNIDRENPIFNPPLWLLYNAQLELSAYKMWRQTLTKYQSAALLKIIGEYADDIDVGVSGIINITSEKGDADYISPNAPISDISEAVEACFTEIGLTFQLPSQAFTIKSYLSSGVAIEANRKSMHEFIQQRAKQFLPYERELFTKALKILAHHRGIPVPDDLQVNIEHKLPRSPIDSQQIQQWQFELLNHIITPADILMDRDQNLTRKDAEKIIKANKAANSLFEEGA